MMGSEGQHMVNNSVIKLITDNYDMAKEWYHALMENEEIPGVGKLNGLPEEHEARVDAVALLIISTLEFFRTGNREIQLPTEETAEAIFIFEYLMDADLQQKPTERNGLGR